ncbi:MAG: Na+/H+ antiporter NhaA, partial [Leeuwenhoekiella sp.]|nr:Na+/H+ antiporter NhaA [Leeuwenhoekiella sp.]
TMLIINIIVCLVLGKSIGITAIVVLVQKMRLIVVPKDITLQHIIGTSFLAGIGFTMAIFVSNLAFASDPIYNLSAKMGILIGSLIAAILGYLILRFKRGE